MSKIYRVRASTGCPAGDAPVGFLLPGLLDLQGPIPWVRILRAWAGPPQLVAETPPQAGGASICIEEQSLWRPLYGRDTFSFTKPVRRLRVSGICVDVEVGDDESEAFPGPVTTPEGLEWVGTVAQTFGDGDLVSTVITGPCSKLPFPVYDYRELLIAATNSDRENAASLEYWTVDGTTPIDGDSFYEAQDLGELGSVPEKPADIGPPGMARFVVSPTATGTDSFQWTPGLGVWLVVSNARSGVVTWSVYGRR